MYYKVITDCLAIKKGTIIHPFFLTKKIQFDQNEGKWYGNFEYLETHDQFYKPIIEDLADEVLYSYKFGEVVEFVENRTTFNINLKVLMKDYGKKLISEIISEAEEEIAMSEKTDYDKGYNSGIDFVIRKAEQIKEDYVNE